MRNYTEPFLIAFDHVQELGRNFGEENPNYFENEINKGTADDLAIICYTSGTTGNPKGVLCCRIMRWWMLPDVLSNYEGLTEHEEIMAYLPMAWIGDHIFSYGEAMVAGFTANCPENTSTVVSDMREDRPDLSFLPSAHLGKYAHPGHDQNGRRRLDKT